MWRVYCCVSAMAAGCFLNALWGDFVHDDIPAVTRNKDVLGLSPLPELLQNDFWGTNMADLNSHKSYRPLTTLTFRFNCWLCGLWPLGFHALNVLLHVSVCVLFARACVSVARLSRPCTLLAGLFFAAHPIHTEAVSSVVGRADVLACVFFLLSFLAYHDGSSGGRVFLSAVMACLAMLSKETGFTALPVNLLFDMHRSWGCIRRSVRERRWNQQALRFCRRAVKVVLSMIVLLVFRLSLLQGSFPRFARSDNPAAFHPSPQVRLLTFFYLSALHCWLLICPSTLSHDWQFGSVPLVISLDDKRNLATGCFLVFILLLAYRSVVNFERYPGVVLGFLVLVVPFLPASNLLVTVGFVVAERVLYIPSLGCALLLGVGAQTLCGINNVKSQSTSRPWTKFVLIGAVVLLAASSARTLSRNRDWSSRGSLIASGLRALPLNAKMHYNMGNYLRDIGKEEEAKRHYQEALRLWPDYASAANNLGTLMRDPVRAEELFLEAIRVHPGHVNAHYNLGHVYRRENRTMESLRALERCLQLDPEYAPAYRMLASVVQGSRAGALLDKLAKIKPTARNVASLAYWLLRNNMVVRSITVTRQFLSTNQADARELLLVFLRGLRAAGQLGRVHQVALRWRILALGGTGVFQRQNSAFSLVPVPHWAFRDSNKSSPQSETSEPAPALLDPSSIYTHPTASLALDSS